MFSWFQSLSNDIQKIILVAISGALGFAGKALYESISMHYKMRKEYYFKQKKSIKEKLALTKTPLIKSAEELNYRLWNLSNNIDKKWHNIDESNWKTTRCYYLKSFTYRFLTFIYWTLKAEESIYSFDFTLAKNEDKEFLKYVKTLKHFFCESILLEDLGYTGEDCLNHFYKDYLSKYTNYIIEDGQVIDFSTFERKFLLDYDNIKAVVVYITNIENDPKNLNYNVVMVFHLFLMLFLNKYGLNYHKTDKKKIIELIKGKYADISIKKGFYKFLDRNKVIDETSFIIKRLELS